MRALAQLAPWHAAPVDVEALRVRVYRRFANTGGAPRLEELASELDESVTTIRAGLRDLAAARHLVLDKHDAIVMAHPFSAIPLGFSVMSATTLWWGGCAWDSFALPHLVPGAESMLVATRCPGCSSAHAWNVRRERPPSADQLAHFLVPAARMWDDVVNTCGHQRIFCSEACVNDWLAATSNKRGYVMDLPTLWRLASRWYEGRLEAGYVRREPSAAADYLRSVGLVGPFWGT
jgi:hypothetical protein